MRLVEYCDLGDAPEFRVQRVGSVELVSPNLVRITFVVKVPGKPEHVAVAHHFWDISDLRKELGVALQAMPLIERAHAVAVEADVAAHH